MSKMDDEHWPLIGQCEVCLSIAFARQGRAVCMPCRRSTTQHNNSTNAMCWVAGSAASSSADAVAVASSSHIEQNFGGKVEYMGAEFIVRSDGVVEPAPGQGKHRPDRRRGKVSRAKSRAWHEEKRQG